MVPRSPSVPARPGVLRETLLICSLLTVLTLAAYGPVWTLGFVNIDDQPYVTENPHVTAGLSRSAVVWAFTTTRESNWHPLTWLSLQVDATFADTDPRVFHATNLLLHIANTLLLFLVLLRMTGFPWRSAFVAALFAVHPLHVESVAWVSERKDVLSTLFWMLALGAYVRYAARPSWGRYAALAVFMLLGLLAKPMLVSLPIVLLLLDYWPLGRWRLGPRAGRSLTPPAPKLEGVESATAATGAPPGSPARGSALLLEKLPLFALAAVACVVTLLVQQRSIAILDLTFSQRAANALSSYVLYIGQMILPIRLSAFYPHAHGTIPLGMTAAYGLLLTVVSVTALALARRRPWILVGWLWYVVTLVPVIGLIQVGIQARADRYTYVPLIGLFIVIAWGVPEVAAMLLRAAAARSQRAGGALDPDRDASGRSREGVLLRRILWAPALGVLFVLSGLTWVQVQSWKDGITLWKHALEATENNPVAHNDLALLLANRGEVDEAVVHLREALRIAPWFLDAHFNLTNTLMGMGKLEEAEALCREEQSLWPADDRTYLDRGLLFLLRQEPREAETQFKKALTLNPDEFFAHMNLAWIRAGEGRIAEANACFEEVVRIVGPDKARQLGKGQFPMPSPDRSSQ